MKPLEFVNDHKVEIGVGIVAIAAVTVGFAYGYKVGYSSGVKNFAKSLNAIKNVAKETGKAVPAVVRGLNDSNIEIPIKVFPEIIEDFPKRTSTVRI